MFYDTLLDENAASHIAFGSGFPFLVEGDDVARVNSSALHIDFMIGSPELEVDGVTAAGDRVAVLRGGNWQISGALPAACGQVFALPCQWTHNPAGPSASVSPAQGHLWRVVCAFVNLGLTTGRVGSRLVP